MEQCIALVHGIPCSYPLVRFLWFQCPPRWKSLDLKVLSSSEDTTFLMDLTSHGAGQRLVMSVLKYLILKERLCAGYV